MMVQRYIWLGTSITHSCKVLSDSDRMLATMFHWLAEILATHGREIGGTTNSGDDSTLQEVLGLRRKFTRTICQMLSGRSELKI